MVRKVGWVDQPTCGCHRIAVPVPVPVAFITVTVPVPVSFVRHCKRNLRGESQQQHDN